MEGPLFGYSISPYYRSGDAGDWLRGIYRKGFSTYDRDPTGCVKTRHSAWWYPDDCGNVYLNSPNARGNVWGDYSNLQFSEMKMKPRDSTHWYTPQP
ncbi:ficolin-1-B-like [Pomacea canaliculata]|uniref:ficolin-1-B-like n=1 Tax=Pomacea canaliculata TaxID=400727 RepID=UPI000D7337F9|nr:ficolin-1-B-like [Pomacea canaliculata]